jgi:CheY-like chemotaxis protein
MSNPQPKPTNAAATPANSIRLDSGRLNRFLDDRDRLSAQNESKPRRDFVRWPFRNACIALTVVHPGGSNSVFNVACRNLSSGGIGILHSSYMHKGTRCFISLPRTDGQKVSMEGTIVRCSHVSGTIHEIGIQFLKPIDAKQYVELDPFSNGFSLETVDPENLRGTVLYIEDSALDQALIRHYLRETQIRLIVVADVQEGLKKALEGVDLILCDYNVGQEMGSSFVARAREAGLSQPILMVTADTSSFTRQQLIKAQATAFITKPVKQQTLFRALAEFMMLGADAGGISSSLPASHANVALLDTFVDETKLIARSLETAMRQENAAKARQLCLQIMGSAPEMGFERLAELARAAEKAVSSTMSCTESAVPLRTLIGACQRTTPRHAA